MKRQALVALGSATWLLSSVCFNIASPTMAYASSQSLLQAGSKGTAVTQLQSQLNSLGFSCGTADGVFGPKTTGAVKAFQKKNHLAVDGVVGAQTESVISKLLKSAHTVAPVKPSTPSKAPVFPGKTLKYGSTGSTVKTIQAQLNKLGFHSGTVDGQYGATTQAAVKAFEKAHKLTQDGQVSLSTWNALFKTSVSGSGSSSGGKSGGSVGSTTPTPPPGTTLPSITKSIQKGSTGPVVAAYQNALNKLGFSCGTADGQFGPNTIGAVQRFQAAHHVTADGVIGPVTAKAIQSALSATKTTPPPTPPPSNQYTACSKTGVVIGGYPTLAQAESDLSGYDSAVVKDSSGKVVYTSPSLNDSTSNFTNVDLRHPAPNSVTAQSIDGYLANHPSPLTGLGTAMMETQRIYGINANYLLSHAILETGWGVSYIYKHYNNLYGYGAYDQDPNKAGAYPTFEYAVLFQGWEVRSNYLTSGSSLFVSPTLSGMNVHYATDKSWANSISGLMNQYASTVSDNAASYQQYSSSNSEAVPSSTSEPIWLTEGAKGTTVADPVYGNHVPVFSTFYNGETNAFFGNIKVGATGTVVYAIQRALNQKVHSNLTVDGDFGPATQTSLKQYQSSVLHISSSSSAYGMCDLNTWNNLIGSEATTVNAGDSIAIDQVEIGMGGGYVIPWFHVTDGRVSGWVPVQDAQFTNLYYVTANSGYTFNIYNGGGQSELSLHSGDELVVTNPKASGGLISVTTSNPYTGARVSGYLRTSEVTITKTPSIYKQ